MFPSFVANISALQTLTHVTLSSQNKNSDTSYLDPKPWSEIEKERDEAEIEMEVDRIINELEKEEQAKINVMPPKEKAEELVRKFYTFGINNTPMQSYSWYECKKLALIAVNEMIAFTKHAFSYINAELATPSITYLEEVKQEIEKL
jgi:hypothetical protein